MTEHETIRRQIAEDYARAILAPSPCGCDGEPSTKGMAAQQAGYSAEELDELPNDAVINAFGCGNPLSYTDIREGDVVVDLGSGAGIDLLLAARRVGPGGRVIGIDMTDEMIERSRANLAAAGVTNVDVRRGLIEAMPVESASVDWVISNCVINLSPEKDRVFAEIAHVLRPGGHVRVSDLVVEDGPNGRPAVAARWSGCVAGAISEAEYVAGLRRAGLVDVEVVARHPYGQAQLAALFESEAAPAEAEGCCGAGGAGTATACGTEATAERGTELAAELGGHVRSVMITAPAVLTAHGPPRPVRPHDKYGVGR